MTPPFIVVTVGGVEYVALLSKEGKRTLVDFPDFPGCHTFAEPWERVTDVAREALEGHLAVSQ